MSTPATTPLATIATADDNIIGLDADDQVDAPKLRLIAGDGTEVLVDPAHARFSNVIKVAMENDEKETELKLPAITGACLVVMVRWMTLQGIASGNGVVLEPIVKPIKSKVLTENIVNAADQEFLATIDPTDMRSVYDCITAANYLHIEHLVSLYATIIATRLKDQPIGEIENLLRPTPST